MKKIKHTLLLLIMLLATALIGAATPTTSISGDNAKPTFANADEVSISVGAIESPADLVELQSSPSNPTLFDRSTITTEPLQDYEKSIWLGFSNNEKHLPDIAKRDNAKDYDSAESTRKLQAFHKIE